MKKGTAAPEQSVSSEGLHWGGMVVPVAFVGWLIVVGYLQWNSGAFAPAELFGSILVGFPVAAITGVLVMLARVLFRALAKAIAAILVPLLTPEVRRTDGDRTG